MPPRMNELLAWERELIEEQEKLARELEPLLSRRETLKVKLELVQRLKSVEADGIGRPADGQAGDVSPPAVPTTVGTELQAAVRQVLQERGKPMHVSEIRAALTERGIPIPGKGTDANVIVHLRRALDVFERRGRGTYGLMEWKGRRQSKVG